MGTPACFSVETQLAWSLVVISVLNLAATIANRIRLSPRRGYGPSSLSWSSGSGRVAGEAGEVHAHQHVLFAAHVAAHHRQVLGAGDRVLVKMQGELAEARGQ